MLLEADLASAAQQHSAAITARKLIGQELFGQFTDRRETINIDMDYRSADELKAALIRDYGREIADGTWAKWNAPKQIEYDATDAERITDSPNDTETETPNKNSLQSLQTRPKPHNEPHSNQAEYSDRGSKRDPRHDLAHQERLAARSLADSAPPISDKPALSAT